ncbi:unnamed protein product [Anisakis simplex]|uniref:Fibronectin type III domain protein n=1 Tax=Anisakis simplex TaxID=6269 RepID=A0A0M3JY02_ANISI|nr:unnamed protein product [Anisakis simplex]
MFRAGDENGVVDAFKNKLKITPPSLTGNKYVVKSDKTFHVSCTFDGEDLADINQLSWQNENDRKIDGESSSSLFTVALHEHGTHHKKLSMVFAKIAPRDAGTYKCVAVDLTAQTHIKIIHVVVVDSIVWNEKEDTVGGMLGESLTIDCGATGNPQPEIEITDSDGEPLNVAPEFSNPSITRHAIFGRSATLLCETTASNPPATHFRIFKGTKLLNDDDRYELIVDVERQSAVFKIITVEEDDFGEYICEASNSKAKSQQAIMLIEANPPDEIRASLVRTGTNAIWWKLEVVGNTAKLPILGYTIEFIRKNLFDDLAASEQNLDTEQIWRTQATRLTTPTMSDDVYEVKGLRHDTNYVFKLSAQNEAGSSDPAIIIARTLAYNEVLEETNQKSNFAQLSSDGL